MTPEERNEMMLEIAEVVRSASPHLSAEEQQWVRMAIRREAQSVELRQAIIEKTLSSLLWSALVGLGYIVVNYLTNVLSKH